MSAQMCDVQSDPSFLNTHAHIYLIEIKSSTSCYQGINLAGTKNLSTYLNAAMII